MSTALGALPLPLSRDWRSIAPALAAGVGFAALSLNPLLLLLRDWWSDPEAGHGLLLGPLAVYLAWQRGWCARGSAQPVLGILLLLGAVLLRYVAELASERFSLRLAVLLAACALVVFARGVRQLIHWWLPALLLLLSIPLPVVVLQSFALPLQFRASEMGAWLLTHRHIPVQLTGNVIHLPGHSLFVTEACSGLRSLTSLLALALLIGGVWLRWPPSRVALVAASIPIAILLNGIRVFLVGFLVYYVDPRLGEGLLHLTEGWLIFLVALALLGALAWGLSGLERVCGRRPC